MVYYLYINAAANYDHQAHAVALLIVGAAGTVPHGGNGGGVVQLPKPMVATAGAVVAASVVNNTNLDCALAIAVWGYEVDV